MLVLFSWTQFLLPNPPLCLLRVLCSHDSCESKFNNNKKVQAEDLTQGLTCPRPLPLGYIPRHQIGISIMINMTIL
jgi:hypothetical protein